MSRPMLVLGPSLGTSVAALWGPVAALLGEEVEVIGWDLPGHGASTWTAPDDLTMAGLAAHVLELLDARGVEHFHYAGDSVGGAVGLQLLLDAPDRVRTATLCCTGARIGSPESWAERAAQVRASGTPSLVSASAQRWFAPGFLEREPAAGSALLHTLADADAAGYAAVCHALGAFDVRDRLGRITAPVLAVAGAHDVATPPSSLAEIADGVADGRLVTFDDVAHLAPIEAPERVAALLRDQLAR